MTDPTPQFLDVPTLLAASRPKPRGNWFWYAVGGFFFIVLLGTLISSGSPAGRLLVDTSALLLTIAFIITISVLTMLTMRKHREAQLQLEAAEELVQLRRWPEAGAMLTQILSVPVRTQGMRFEALLYLTSVLARYHRFTDAIAVQTHLLESTKVDPATERALKLGRAMAMLREDHLFDADQAINDLRRGEGRENSGGLALVEIYRDVKTGHPAEAIEVFRQRLPILREQLGHRVADAYALAARAHDLLDQRGEAQQAWVRATLLAPPEELARRYPDVASLLTKYVAAEVPETADGAKPQATAAPSMTNDVKTGDLS